MKDYNNNDSKERVDKKELEEIAGGKGELKKGSAALVGSLMMLGGTPGISAGSTNLSAQKSSSFSKKWLIPAAAGGALTDDNFLRNTNLNEINTKGETENKCRKAFKVYRRSKNLRRS